MAQVLNPLTDTQNSGAGDEVFASVQNLTKNYGNTQALRGVDLTINRGEILGLVGHNGAGKSTLVRVLAGLEHNDGGEVTVAGQATGADWRLAEAERRGVRMAYQELSLCADLTVAESGYLSDRASLPALGWRRASRERIARALEEIFPGHRIPLAQRVRNLSMAQRQMVEIARATCTDSLRLLILDEPTESLGIDAADQMYSYLRGLAARGVSVLLISHRMHEVIAHSARIAVLKDGQVVDVVASAGVDERHLINAMGGESSGSTDETAGPETRSHRPSLQAADEVVLLNLGKDSGAMSASSGEIVGLAGLAGQGQETALARLWRPGFFSRSVRVPKNRAYVPGDRQTSGVLPMWGVAQNLTVSAVPGMSKSGVIDARRCASVAAAWIDRLKIKGGPSTPITALSGGNQQKVLVARAFATDAELVLLDDPFRGVDVKTKNELYALMKAEACKGRTIIWYSTENQEMTHCNRVYIFRAGRIVSELHGSEITEERIIAQSFDNSSRGQS